MQYRTYIFDFDFTLADATEGIVQSANYALHTLGFEEKPTDVIRQTVGKTLKETFVILTGATDEARAARFVSYFKEKADEVMTGHTKLFPDTLKVLSALKAEKRNTAIVTSKLRYRIDDALRKFDATGLVDYIVGFDDVKIPKPDPEGLIKALAHFQETRCNALYVGDSRVDAQTAASASVDFAAVTTGTTCSADFAGLPAVYIGQSLTDLREHAFGYNTKLKNRIISK